MVRHPVTHMNNIQHDINIVKYMFLLKIIEVRDRTKSFMAQALQTIYAVSRFRRLILHL